jgi:feruloyl esterase
MTEAMVARHGIDRKRVFVTGLSAGGAMASVMLATYPDEYAGGAIIAGLPFGVASNVQEALDAMFQGRTRPASEWGDLVRGASRHQGPWPKVSVWHGTADATVKPVNADEIVKQWTDVHGIRSRPEEDRVDGFPRRVWRAPNGSAIVESYSITGMAHGTPLATGAGERAAGTAGPFLLDVGISSTYRIAESWGLLDGAGQREGARAEPRVGTTQVLEAEVLSEREGPRSEQPVNGSQVLQGKSLTAPDEPGPEPSAGPTKILHGEVLTGEPEDGRPAGGKSTAAPIDIGATITKALRAAGLIKG